jgi:carbonic anhydrase
MWQFLQVLMLASRPVVIAAPMLLVAMWLSPPALAKGAAPAAKAEAAVTPQESFSRLQAGNRRFISGQPRKGKVSPRDRRALAQGQRPHTVVVACSDSRVPPELVFDQGLGELFVVREAGNGLDEVGLASIEFAVQKLGARLIVVMGHESCGAVQAGLKTPEGTSTGSSNLDVLVASVQANLKTGTLTEADKADPKLSQVARVNVDAVTRHLTERSSVLRQKVESGEVAIVSAIYPLDTGRVEFWNTERLKKAAPTATRP